MHGGETHFNDILREKIDPDLGYFDPMRAYHWREHEKWKKEQAARERENRWPEYCAGGGV